MEKEYKKMQFESIEIKKAHFDLGKDITYKRYNDDEYLQVKMLNKLKTEFG